MDNIVLKLNRHHIKLVYDDDKKIVPLVNYLNFNDYANYMVNFGRVDSPKITFTSNEGEHIKVYFVCASIYTYRDGFGCHSFI